MTSWVKNPLGRHQLPVLFVSFLWRNHLNHPCVFSFVHVYKTYPICATYEQKTKLGHLHSRWYLLLVLFHSFYTFGKEMKKYADLIHCWWLMGNCWSCPALTDQKALSSHVHCCHSLNSLKVALCLFMSSVCDAIWHELCILILTNTDNNKAPLCHSYHHLMIWASESCWLFNVV